jgi:hypothetical protein
MKRQPSSGSTARLDVRETLKAGVDTGWTDAQPWFRLHADIVRARKCWMVRVWLIPALGLVTDRVGDLALSHEDYMWSVVGRRWASRYPGSAEEPLDGFRHLLAGLQQFGSDFLAGTDDDFAKHVQRANSLKQSAPRLPL